MINSEKTLSPKSVMQSNLQQHLPSIAIAFIILGIFLRSLLKDSFGLIGPDNDDVMRLVQIKDYLAGQSWFHTDQYRLGVANGTDMHWSRIPDIPIILLTHFFDIFMPQDKALIWAFTLWPPFTALLLIYGCLVGARHWSPDKLRDKTKVFVLMLLAIYIVHFHRFSPGSIDHHNLQLGFLSLAIGFILDPKFRFRSYFISGFALAMTVAIGGEIYLFAAIICGFVALNWAYYGDKVRAGTQGFGLGFALTLLLAFFGTIAPSEYGLIYCDALSLITISAGVIGALGLALLSKIAFEDLKKRVIGLGVLGLICAAVLGVNAPQCLSNPLDFLPDEVTSLWLNYIVEAQPITAKSGDMYITLPYMLFAPIIAVLVIFRHKPDHDRPDQKQSKFLLITLLLAALGLVTYQIRFFPFAYIVAIVPLAAWIAKVYHDTKLKNPNSVVYLAALVASAPLAWMLPGVFIGAALTAEEDLASEGAQIQCASEDVLSSLNALPLGTILAHPNMAGDILNKTNHRSLSGNYHRNWQGISVQIQVAISDPVKAGELLLENKIDYVYLCQGASETKIYKDHNEKGLTAQLSEGVIPDYLDIISDPDLEDGEVVIFKVKHAKR